jgi:hypothetical protein
MANSKCEGTLSGGQRLPNGVSQILLGWAMLRTTVEDLNSGSMVYLVGLRYLQQHF